MKIKVDPYNAHESSATDCQVHLYQSYFMIYNIYTKKNLNIKKKPWMTMIWGWNSTPNDSWSGVPGLHQVGTATFISQHCIRSSDSDFIWFLGIF